MRLRDYLKAKKIDEIVDDQEFMEAECEATVDYCYLKDFLLSEDDYDCMVERGIDYTFAIMLETFVSDLWDDFCRISSGGIITTRWRQYPPGTSVGLIEEWFKVRYDYPKKEDKWWENEEEE